MPDSNYSKEGTTKMLPLDGGKRAALDALLPLVYEELHRQAHRCLRGERENHTLQTSALINEAYLRLAEQKYVGWQNRAHFFGIAGNMMRRILVDYAKNRRRLKRGGSGENLPLTAAATMTVQGDGAVTDETARIDLILLDAALNKLAAKNTERARVVELRYFAGLTIEETAEALEISVMTVSRHWNIARAWLRREIINVGAKSET